MIIKRQASLSDIQGGNLSDYSAIKNKMEGDYRNNTTAWQQFFLNCNTDNHYEAGIATGSYLSPFLGGNSNFTSNFYFNNIRPLVNNITGYQRQNRKSTIVVPLENGDNETASDWTKIILGVYKRTNAYENISDAFFRGPVVTGLSLLHVYLDYSYDEVNGDIKMEVVSPTEVYMDPYFSKHDLSDCQFIWKRTFLAPSVCANLVPGKYDFIMGLTGSQVGKNGKFNFMPEYFGQATGNLFAYDEYYYRSFRNQKVLIDKETAEILDVTSEDQEYIDNFIAQNPSVYLSSRDIPTIRKCIQVQEHVVYDGPSGLDSYPFILFLGYFNPSLQLLHQRVQGVVRSMRSAEDLNNHYIKTLGQMVDSQILTGYKFKEEAVVDLKYLHDNRYNKLIPIKRGSTMQDVEQIAPNEIPITFFQLRELFEGQIAKTSGVTPELMGINNAENPTLSGIQEVIRTSAGLINLQRLFDQLDISQNMLGNLIMEIVRNNYTPAKVKKILEKDPSPDFYNKIWGKYHCNVESGFNTETAKQMEFAQLIQLRNLQVPGLDGALLEAATIQNKDKILKRLEEQNQQAQQVQQQQSQAQEQQFQAQIEMMVSKALADKGLYAERLSKIEETKALNVQRISEANKNDELATLNKLKAIKELEQIDLTHIQTLLGMVRELKASEQAQVAQNIQYTEQPIENSPIIQSELQEENNNIPQASQGGPEVVDRGI